MKRAFEEPGLPAVVRMAAWYAMQAKTYMKPGQWLHNLNALDLIFLLNLVDQCNDAPADPATGALISLTMILVQAEGLELDSPEQLNSQVNQLGLFLTIESLSRKGLVDVEHGNISFGDDAGSTPFVRTKE
jgi:hypothetical protein